MGINLADSHDSIFWCVFGVVSSSFLLIVSILFHRGISCPHYQKCSDKKLILLSSLKLESHYCILKKEKCHLISSTMVWTFKNNFNVLLTI